VRKRAAAVIRTARKIGGHEGIERRTDAMGCCSTYNRNIYDPLNYTVLRF
jgi:hypothetical protein